MNQPASLHRPAHEFPAPATELPGPLGAAANSPSEDDLELMVRRFDVRDTAFIPRGLTIRGDLDTEGSAAVVVFGTVTGAVKAGNKMVIVMPEAVVEGPITTQGEVVVAGTVGTEGSSQLVISAGQRFHLSQTGRVHGDVAYRSMRIYEGGTVAGRLIPNTGSA